MTGTVAGVILAGGRASRMGGGDKGLLQLGRSTILARIIERLRPQVRWLALNANGEPSRFGGHGLPVLSDPVEGHAGPLAGILAGLQWAADMPGCTHIVTTAADTPFIPPDLVARLLSANEGSENRIVYAQTENGAHAVIALWPVNLTDPLDGHLRGGGAKVMDFIRGHDHRGAYFPLLSASEGQHDPFFNINTPEDLELAQRIVAEER